MLPERMVIGEGYPNPMYDQFTIPVLLPESKQGYDVQFAIYSSAGQLVAILEWNDMPPGYNTVGWHRENKENRGVQPGLYFYRLTVSGQTKTHNGRILVE
jgi:hypothetical protein